MSAARGGVRGVWRLWELVRTGLAVIFTEFGGNLRDFFARQQPTIWLLSLVIGGVVGVGAILFRLGIGLVQLSWLGTQGEAIHSAAAALPAVVILLAPTLGGLVVGLWLQFLQPMRRTSSVADVMEARVRGGRGLAFWPGLSSAGVTILSLGCGASAGREGPVVHFGATLSSAICDFFRLPVSGRKVLLACGVASAVSASFNAPIAGALFAHEVVLGHYALSAIVPIVISSVVGSLLSRLWFGDVAAFVIPDHQITSYWEFPAFALLGVTCAVVAILFQAAVIGSDWASRHIAMPIWLRPTVGGLAVGGIAIFFPHVLGVGYEATDMALQSTLPISLMLWLLVMKTAATAITLASRFGGGIFSPSLYLGAMAGGAYGLIAASVFPHFASSEGLYAILGMGAVAASTLGAPVSTVMIVFELTGGYALSIALLITVFIAVGITQAVYGRSYFHWQLESRGIILQEGAHQWLVNRVHVSDFFIRAKPGEEPGDLTGDQPHLVTTDTLEFALRRFDDTGEARLPVVEPGSNAIVGTAAHVRALRYFNAALIEASVEEHR